MKKNKKDKKEEKKTLPRLLKKKDKQAIRHILLEQKRELLQKLSATFSESKDIETDIAQDVADRAESSYTKEFLLSLSNSDRTKLLRIDEALKAVEKGVYGICQMCGQPISPKRLEVLPGTIYCINCQQRIEEGSEQEA